MTFLVIHDFAEAGFIESLDLTLPANLDLFDRRPWQPYPQGPSLCADRALAALLAQL